ncbi:DUF7210 family protein [Roseovarius sp. D0-M9]|uniref:DUF7210 family protein n=1 Tax=Roseovarius sp. D0-M9 TaxID=3127117 RepID=UPI00300FA33F
MAKTHVCKVTKAFVHGGKIRVPGKSLTLSEAEAKPLLEAGKVVLSKEDPADDQKSKAEIKAEADAKAKAEADAKAKEAADAKTAKG